MNPLDTYLARHFLNADQIASLCRLSRNELADLIQHRLIPRPAYIVSQSGVRSHVFGEMQAAGATNGEYFHPATKVWVSNAQTVIAEVGRRQAYEELKKRFAGNLQIALTDLNATTWRLHDSFAAEGVVIPQGLRTRVDSMWEHFLHGTYGLCVANPFSEAAIASKEVLQEKLIALTDNGIKAAFLESEAQTLLELISAYAQATMPFSPIEYPVSSRKRLVEDVSTAIQRSAFSWRIAAPEMKAASLMDD